MPAGIHDSSKLLQDKREHIINLLAAKVPMPLIAQQTNASASTVVAVNARNHAQVLDARERIMSSITRAAEGMSERLANCFNDIPIAQLPIATAVVIDKWLLLQGEATSRIDHTSSQDGVLTLRDELSQIPEAQVLECTTVSSPVESKGPATQP